MEEFAHLVRLIPDTVWAALIAALIAFVATTLTNRNTRKLLRIQLAHDGQQRDRERAAALRREVYLQAAEALVRGQHALGDLVKLEAPLEDSQKHINEVLVAAARVHLVGDEPTVQAVLEYVSALMPAYLEVLNQRLPLALRAQQAKQFQGTADRAAADMGRTTELMKQFNLSGRHDPDAWNRIVRQSEGEQKLMNQYTERATELRNMNTIEHQEFAKNATRLAVQIARHFPDAVLSARRELGLPIDEATYRRLFAKQEADAVRTSEEFFAKLRTLVGGNNAQGKSDEP